MYSNVKSKVAGNMRSQRKSKAKLTGGSYLLDNDPSVGSSPTNPYAPQSSLRKSQAARSSGKYDGSFSAAGKSGRSSASVPVSQPASKSKIPKEQMDAIIRGIKERYSQEVIAQMSNEELS